MAALLLLEQRKQDAQGRRQVLFDRCCDYVAYCCLCLYVLDVAVERRQYHDGLRAGALQRRFHLAFCVRGIDRTYDSAHFPRADLGNQELRTVREDECHAVSVAHTEFGERRGKSVTFAFELPVGDFDAFEEER